MVDSAVTLSIGTELDLSGLQKDLAALKNQKFNFDFDADKIGRSFREANRQMQLKPRVDLSELHELNRLLDVKLNHVKKVQKYFDSNPLRVRIDSRSLDLLKNIQQAKSGSIRVTGRLSETRESVTQLKEINKNTKSSFIKSFKTGATESLGASLVSDSIIGKTTKKIGSSLEQAVITALKKAGSLSFEQGEVLADLLDTIESIVVGTDDWKKSLSAVYKEVVPALAGVKGFDGVFKKIQSISAEIEGQEASLENTLNLLKKIGKEAAVYSAGIAFKPAAAKLDTFLKERREKGIRRGAEIAQGQVEAQRKSVRRKVKEDTPELYLTTGGYGGARGLSGKRIAGDFERQGRKAIAIINADSDVNPEARKEGGKMYLASAAKSLAKPNLRGYSKDAVDMVAKALAAREINPNIEIKIFGESGGGFVAEEAVKMLEILGVQNVKGIAVGTPDFIGSPRPKEFTKVMSPDDPVAKDVDPLLPFGLAKRDTPQQQIQGVIEHTYENYVDVAESLDFFFGQIENVTKEIADDLLQTVEEIELNFPSNLADYKMPDIGDTLFSTMQMARRAKGVTTDKNILSVLSKAEEKAGTILPRTPKMDVSAIAEVRTSLADIQERYMGIVNEGEDIVEEFLKIKDLAPALIEITKKMSLSGTFSDVELEKLSDFRREAESILADVTPEKAEMLVGESLSGTLEDVQARLFQLIQQQVSDPKVFASLYDELDQALTQVEDLDSDVVTESFADVIAETEAFLDQLNAVLESVNVPSSDLAPQAIASQALEISEIAPVEVAVPSVEVALKQVADVAEETAQSLDKVGTELDAAFKALGDINEAALETFSTTLEEFRAFMMDSQNLVMGRPGKKGQPDLRVVGKTFGVPTKNPATKKTFTKEELTDYLLGNFDIEAIKEAIVKVGGGLPQINENIGKELASQYEMIDKAIKEIDKTPIEQQLRLWDELETKLLNIDKAMNRMQREFVFPGDINQVFQGRKEAFKQQYFTVKKGQELSAAAQVGRDIAVGGAAGIEQNKDLPIVAIQEMAMEMIEVAKDEFGIQSPSKVFKAIGRDIVRGLEAGGDISPYVDSLFSSIGELKAGLKSKQLNLESILSTGDTSAFSEDINDLIRYIKLLGTSAGFSENDLKELFESVDNFSTKSLDSALQILSDIAEQLERIPSMEVPTKKAVTPSTALIPVQSKVATTSGDRQFNLDALYETVEEAQETVANTEFETGGLNLDGWINSVGEVVTGIKDITSKSWREIGAEFAKNLKIEGIRSAFGELESTVKDSFSRVFSGSFGDQGAPSRFIQGIIGNLTVGLTQLTTVLAARLDGILTAVKGTITGALEGISDFTKNIGQNLGKLAAIVVQAFALTKIVQGAVALGKASFQTALQVEQLTRSLSFSTADGGIATLEKIRQKANELNVSFIEAAQGYSQLAASTLGTSLEGQTENIFEGVATAISARGLSNENQSRAFLAISQIASKGRVSLEELNGQLGEALPGALQTAARALGVTSQELIKMVETGQVTAEDFLPKFADQLALEAGSSVAAAAGSATAQLTKFDNQLTQIRANIGKGLLDGLTKVLPVVNAALELVANNTAFFTSAATVLATVLAINLGKAILTVASQLKIVNLLMAMFGLNIAPATSLATRKATFAINGMNVSLAGTTTALKALAVQTLPLLAVAAAFNGIRAVLTPLNEDIAKTSKGLGDIANRLEKQRKSGDKDVGGNTAISGVFEEPTAARAAIAFTSSGIPGGLKQIALARDFAIQRANGIENVSRSYLQASVATEKLLSGITFGLAKRSDTSFAVEQFLELSKQAREAARAVKEVQQAFAPLSAEATAQLQQIDDEAKKLRVQINVESARGGDTSALKEQLDLLQDQRRGILGAVEGYDEAVAVSQQLDDAIGNLNKQYEDNKISTTDYNKELGFLQGLQAKNQALLDQYAESTNTITTNVQKLASEIRSVSLELDKARSDAERTATAAQTALIKERLGGGISATDFGVEQAAITKQQTEAIATATESAQAKAFDAIQKLDKSVVEQLEIAFGGAGFTGGLSQVLSEATTESLEQAKTAFQTAGGDIDPTGEAAISAIQQYIELRDQSLNLEKELAQLELDRRQQVADSLQQEIDLQNNRAAAAIEVANLQSQVSLTAKQAASQLSSFDLELANFAEQARAARAEAGRLTASAEENRLAAQNQDLLPEDRERFIQAATREALEAQLKEQEAVLAETQANIARALRPIEIGEQAAQIREQELQVTNAIRENIVASSKALSDFDRQIIGFGNSISQLIEEATNLESGAIAKRTAAGTAALPPDERRRLLREAQADELLAQQKRSEAELQRVEAGRVTQLREVEMATKAAQVANTEYYQSRKIAILTEQANAKTADEIATAAIISQKKQLDLEIEFTQRKIALNRQELTQQRDLYRQGVIDLDTFNERVIALDEERLQLQEQAVDQRIQLNQREIDNLNTLKEQLRSLDQIRNSVVEAQLGSQQRLIQSANVYGDALSQQAELIRVAADAQRQANEAAIAGAEADNARLGERRGLIDSLRSALGLKEAPEEIKALQDQVQSLVKDLDFGRGFKLNLKDMGGEELFGLLQNLKEAQKLGLTGDQLTLTNSLTLEEEIQKRNLEIEQQRQAIQEQEKETQKQLLAIEIERNKVAAQTQIKEAEIAALRAKSAVTTAQIEARRASTPEEAIQAQLALLQAQEEFQFALSGIDLAKQNAVITDRLAELQGGGMAIALDPDVQKIADIGKSMESIVDFSKYDELLSQLERAATPLENEIGVQERAVNATNKLSTGIDLLNQKIERLVTTLGRPNIAVSGGGSVSEAIEIMRTVG